eukprot:7514033-Pyramimonas_sp.AAC.1
MTPSEARPGVLLRTAKEPGAKGRARRLVWKCLGRASERAVLGHVLGSSAGQQAMEGGIVPKTANEPNAIESRRERAI